MSNSIDYKAQSRKWKLVLLIILITTGLVLLPPTISSWFLGTTPLKIITGTEYVSIITLIVSAYFGANVSQKYIENKNK